MIYALIQNGEVENVIIADPDFLTEFAAAPNYTAIVDITSTTPQPSRGWLYDGTNFSAPAPSLPMPDLTQGIILTSISTPALNGTYAADTNAQANVNAVVTFILVNGTFPAGAPELPWYDMAGVPHVFTTTTQFNTFATAFANYVAACALYVNSNGTSGSLPSNQITIA